MQSNSAHSQSGTLATPVHVLSLQTVTTSNSRTLVRCPFSLPVPPTRNQLGLQSSYDNRQEGWHLLVMNSGPVVFPTIKRVHQTHTDLGVHHNLMKRILFTNCIIVPVFCGCADHSEIDLSDFWVSDFGLLQVKSLKEIPICVGMLSAGQVPGSRCINSGAFCVVSGTEPSQAFVWEILS